jgi:hypothetical protein
MLDKKCSFHKAQSKMNEEKGRQVIKQQPRLSSYTQMVSFESGTKRRARVPSVSYFPRYLFAADHAGFLKISTASQV